jgi:hypothetical protein
MPQAARDARSWITALLGDRHVRLCAVIALVVILMPPEGIAGLDMCWWKRMTGLPCPGCGLTRSGSNLARGDLARATSYHALGPVLMPVIFTFGLLALAPRPWRERCRDWLLPGVALIRVVYLLLIALFVLFGVVRTFMVWQGWITFPPAWP